MADFLERPLVVFHEQEANDMLFNFYHELPDWEVVLYEQIPEVFVFFCKLPIELRSTIVSGRSFSIQCSSVTARLGFEAPLNSFADPALG